MQANKGGAAHVRSALREEGMRLEKKQTITMNRKQKQAAVALIRERCANFYQGYCLPLDTQCPQADSDSLLCRWFREAFCLLMRNCRCSSHQTLHQSTAPYVDDCSEPCPIGQSIAENVPLRMQKSNAPHGREKTELNGDVP